jgi:tRNA uridine 5-carboxymethylaminomethyl modification enzyme
LRIDNADRRLTPYARRIGLIPDELWAAYEAKQARAAALDTVLRTRRPEGAAWMALLPRLLAKSGLRLTEKELAVRSTNLPTAENTRGLTFAELLRRPELTLEELWPLLVPELEAEQNELFAPWLEAVEGVAAGQMRVELKAVETEIKYAGYLEQQRRSMAKLKAAEGRLIPEDFSYAGMSGLSREMQETLGRIRPSTIGQASRIPGVTPAALTLLSVFVGAKGRDLRVKTGCN